MGEYQLKDTLFIMQPNSWSRSIVEESGLEVQDQYKGKKSIFLRILREVFFRLNLPGKTLWYKNVRPGYKVYFLFEALMEPDYIEWLHAKFPDAKYILFYMNRARKRTAPSRFNFDYVHIWSGDKHDCEKYGINECPRGGSYVRQWVVNKQEPEYDVFFVGKDKDKKRLPQMLQLEALFSTMGLRTYFHMVAERIWQHNRHYKPFLPYDKCLNMIGKSKAILYIGYGSQECITIRIQESLVHRVKLITDCRWIKKYDFYDKNNIFVLGEDDLSEIKSFLDSPYVDVKSDVLEHIFFDENAKYIINN